MISSMFLAIPPRAYQLPFTYLYYSSTTVIQFLRNLQMHYYFSRGVGSRIKVVRVPIQTARNWEERRTRRKVRSEAKTETARVQVLWKTTWPWTRGKKISVIYTRPSLIVNSSPPPPPRLLLLLFYENALLRFRQFRDSITRNIF